ncbi:MAG: Crp/Fnr family transcriptional regulator [Sulfitobacter sp.]
MNKAPFPKSGFLADASDDLARLLDALAVDVHLDSGDVLFEQGEAGDTLYAVFEGTLEFSVLSSDGRKLSLSVARPGALFGEIALFDPGPRTATVTALEPSSLRGIRHADILTAIQKTPELVVDMLQLAGQRMRWMTVQLNEQVFLPMPARLARKILYLLTDLPDPTAKLKLSQVELAQFVGATREAVSKTLAQWKRDGVVEATRGGIRVIDKEKLQEISDFHLI